ncbi:MAG: hypothetical protein RLZZ58_2321 [Pseudomonadota bacterium]|jgi:hypothetical protein
MTDAKIKIPLLSQPQRLCLEGLSNRRPQAASDPVRDELAAIGLVAQSGGKWALTTSGKKALAAGSNKRNMGGFRV